MIWLLLIFSKNGEALSSGFRVTGMVFTDSKIINEQKGIEYLASERNKAYSNDKLEATYFNDINNRNSRSLSFGGIR